LYARQVQPRLQAAEIMADVNMESFGAEIAALLGSASTPAEMRRTVGTFALAAATVPEPERRAVIESRLPSHQWPLAQTIDELRAGGAEVAVIEPDEASLAAIGANPLDPSTRTPAAEAGRAQGRALQIDWSMA
jgi:hypothetical protein